MMLDLIKIAWQRCLLYGDYLIWNGLDCFGCIDVLQYHSEFCSLIKINSMIMHEVSLYSLESDSMMT